jgi:hypothetical protein
MPDQVQDLQVPFLDLTISGLNRWGLNRSDIIDVRSLRYDGKRRVVYVGCSSSDVQRRDLIVARVGEDGVTFGLPRAYPAHPAPSAERQNIFVQCLGLHPQGKKLYLGLFSIGDAPPFDTPLVVYDLGLDGMPTDRPPRAYRVSEPVTQRFGCLAIALHPTAGLLYAIGRGSWGLAVFKLDPEGEPAEEGAFVTDEIVHYGGVSLGFVAGDGRSRADRLVVGSMTLGPPDIPTMRTVDLNREGMPVGTQTKDYTLANATSAFDLGYASLTVGPKGAYYKTQDAGLGYRLFDATDASSEEGKVAVGSVQAVGGELLDGSLLVALDHTSDDAQNQNPQGNTLKRVDGVSVQRITLGPDGRPAQGVPSEKFWFRRQCALLAAAPSPVAGGTPFGGQSVRGPDLAATIRYLASTSPEAPLPAELYEPWRDYGRNAAAAAERFGVIKAPEREVFPTSFAQAWVQAATVLARPPSDAALPGLDPTQTSRLLVLSWHCPECLRLLPLAPRLGAIVLMCQDAEWFGYLRSVGSLLVTTADGGAARLREALAAGRPLAVMVDHLPTDAGATVTAPLFGQAVPTDVAALRAGRTAGYRFAFVTPRDGQPQIVETIDPRGMTDVDLATRVNALVEHEVRLAPTRWLLWPALPSRAAAANLAQHPV